MDADESEKLPETEILGQMTYVIPQFGYILRLIPPSE